MGGDGASGRGEPDLVQFGSARRRRPPPWAGGLALGAVLVAGVVTVLVRGGPPPPAPPGVRVTEAGHRLLGAASGWDLFGFGPAGLVRIELERGRIIRTAVPPLDSTGPVSLVAGPDQAVIRPLDLVPGYLVPDGRAASPLPGPLRHGGVVLPGPAAGQVWVLAADSPAMTLYSLVRRASGVSVPLPGGPWVSTADGRGGVLLENGNGSFFDAGPGGLRPVRASAVLAPGPARWLEVACLRPGHCFDVAAGPGRGTGRVLPGLPARTVAPAGVVSPDGSVAAVYEPAAGGRVVLRLISLASGATRTVPLAVRGPVGPQALAWSPDSRWLFTVADGGVLRVVNARTGRVGGLGLRLPPLDELAVRSGRAPVHPARVFSK
ncbi:MAG TPA: hypothetical protein VIZ00_16930 [Streptosporangiaceae bacterium]